MTTLLKSLFGGSVLLGPFNDFNDFHLNAESDLAEMYDESPAYSMQGQDNSGVQPARADVWQSTFSPQMNVNMKKVGRSFYDAVDDKEHASTVWENIVKAEAIKRISFKHFDKNNDGLIDAQELKAELGASANVDELIAKVDRDGDGRIDFEEFCDLLRKS